MILLRPIVRAAKIVWFALFFIRELVEANAVVAWEVVTPRNRMRPGIIAVPTRCDTDLEVTLLANLISLTPGTLSLEVTDDRSTIYVHGLHVKTPDQLRARVRRLEDRLLEVLR